MNIIVRKAELNELDTLIEWRMEVLREVFSLSADKSLEELRRENISYYKESLENGGHIACFAQLQNEIVGCGGICIYKEMPSPDNPSGKCAYLMNIYVRSEYRGRGIGEKIVKWLISEAQKQGITKIYLETSDEGRGLYQKAGFSDMSDMMKL